LFCDLTLEGSGLSSTATNSVTVPAALEDASARMAIPSDPDDSWAIAAVEGRSLQPGPGSNPIFHLPGGGQVEWKCQQPLRSNQDASLRFDVRDAAGQPVELEAYMGMLCHAAVLRADGGVFAHLHPSGNYSMAAQAFFEDKLQREQGRQDSGAGLPPVPSGVSPSIDHSKMGHAMHHVHSSGGISSVSVPYEFPTPGDYRIWVQF